MAFSKKGHIDIEELRRYYSNRMTSSERNALEQKALDDPFLKDAMDGFDENPGSFNTFYAKHSSKFRTSRQSTLLIGISVLGLLFIITTLLKQKQPEITDSEMSSNFQFQPKNEDVEKEDKEYEMLPIAIETLAFIPQEEIISPDEILSHQEDVEEYLKNTPTGERIDHIEIAEEVHEDDFSYEDEVIHKPGQPTVPTTYVFDLYIVDYREIKRERKDITYKRYELSGTSANVESDEIGGSELFETEVEVPYYLYLRKSMSFFAENQFKKALNRYLIILEQYPNDLNALFYGGLSYYNLGKYKKSIELFDQIITSKSYVFTEEATWYKVKSLIQLNEKELASKILEDIIAAGGFYAIDAIKLKEEL